MSVLEVVTRRRAVERQRRLITHYDRWKRAERDVRTLWESWCRAPVELQGIWADTFNGALDREEQLAAEYAEAVKA